MTSEFKENPETASNDNFVFRGENSGNYTWYINDVCLIENILNAKNGQKLESDLFIMAQLKWQLILYPNGANQSTKESVMILLKLVSMPYELENIICSYSIRCNKTMSCWSSMVTFNESGADKGWSHKTLLLSEWRWMNLNDLSITVTININHIILNDNKHYLKLCNLLQNSSYLNSKKHIKYKSKSQFEYKIDDKTMNIIKNSYNRKRFESAIFDNMWRLTYFPNGSNEKYKGYLSMFLRLCILPPFISAIKVKYTIYCRETKDCFSFEDEFKYDVQRKGMSKFMTSTKIKSLQSITFIIDIEIINILFINENDKNMNHIYDDTKIEHILSSISNTNTHHQQIENNKNEINNMSLKIDLLSTNMMECNNMIKEIENNMNKMTKQINNLQLIMMEENKIDEMNEMRKEIETIKQNVNKIMMNENLSNNNKEIKEWMINIVQLPQYIDIFIQNGFESLQIMKEAKMNDLTMMGIEKIGHKIKIIKEIAKLNQDNNEQMVYI